MLQRFSDERMICRATSADVNLLLLLLLLTALLGKNELMLLVEVVVPCLLGESVVDLGVLAALSVEVVELGCTTSEAHVTRRDVFARRRVALKVVAPLAVDFRSELFGSDHSLVDVVRGDAVRGGSFEELEVRDRFSGEDLRDDARGGG